MNRTLLPSLLRIACVLIAALCVTACDTTGVHPLRLRRDVLVACSAANSTWLRTTNEGTEVYLIGTADAVSEVPGNTPLCFARGFVKFDSATVLETGIFTLDATGNGTFLASSSYAMAYQPSISVVNRAGAARTDHDPPLPHSLHIEASGNDILLTEDGATRRLANLYDVVGGLDPSTQAGAEEMFKLLNIPLFFSQVRVPSFGGGGMTQYAGITATFQGMINNTFTVHVSTPFNPDTDIGYQGFEDLSGMVFDGLQRTDIVPPLLDGKGSMSGTVSFSVRNGPLPTDVAFVGAMAYDDLNIDNGLAGSGTYLLTTSSPVVTSHDIPFSLANEMDLRTTLPPSTP